MSLTTSLNGVEDIVPPTRFRSPDPPAHSSVGIPSELPRSTRLSNTTAQTHHLSSPTQKTSKVYEFHRSAMSRDRNAGRGHSVKIDNSSTERVEEFKYLGTMLTDQNSIQEEIKSRLKLGNTCYHSVQSLLSSRLLSKNLEIKIYRTIILPVVLYGVKPGR